MGKIKRSLCRILTNLTSPRRGGGIIGTKVGPLAAPRLKGDRLEYLSPSGGDKRRDHQENGVRHNELRHQRARMKSVNLPNTNADLWILAAISGYQTFASRSLSSPGGAEARRCCVAAFLFLSPDNYKYVSCVTARRLLKAAEATQRYVVTLPRSQLAPGAAG